MSSVRYIVDDVDAAVGFYTGLLGFDVVMHPAPSFAMLRRDELTLLLSAASGQGGGGQVTAAGRPEPGGWNRFQLVVADLDAEVARLRDAGARFRTPEVVTGVGGRQVLVDDPAGNAVELFEPTPPAT
jgi:catechol 2,3-dioxygenase-like lactoylglutathione lyase family enzyme